LPHSALPQPSSFAETTLPKEDVIPKPDNVTGVSRSTVGNVALTLELIPVNSATVVGAPSAVPCEEVIDTPDGSTEYSTPHPELLHCCLPQPSTLNDCGVPNADIVPGEVIDTTISSDCHVLAPQVFVPQVDAIRNSSLC